MNWIRRIARRIRNASHKTGIDGWKPPVCESLERRALLAIPHWSNFIFDVEDHRLKITFDIDVRPGQISNPLENTDLALQKLTQVTQEEFIPASSILLDNPTGTQATLSFSNLPIPPSYLPNILPDANYRPSISYNDVADGMNFMRKLGGSAPADAVTDPPIFWVLAGDITSTGGGPRDRQVTLPDFNRLASNFGMTSGATYTDGDIDYDGDVDLQDFNKLAANFGVTLYAPPVGSEVINVDSLGDGTLRVSWDASAAGNNTHWRIQKSTDGQIFTIYTEVLASESFFIDDGDANPNPGGPGLPQGSRIWYRMRAIGGNPETAYTPKRAGTTILPAPQNTRVEPIDGGTLRVAWDDASQGETEFRVFRSNNGIDGWTQVGNPIPTGSPRELFDDFPNPYAQRFYYVSAHNAVTQSAPSNIAVSPPAAPGDATVTLVEVPLRLDLDWPDNPEPSVTYDVYRSTDEDFVPDPAANLVASGLVASFFQDTTVAADTRYYYYVFAVTESGPEQIRIVSFPSGRFTQTTNPRGAPSNLFAEVIDENNIQLTWNDNAWFEQAHYVERQQGAGWVNISGDLPNDRTHFLLQNLTPETDYTLRVSTVLLGGELRHSVPITATTDASGAKIDLVIAILGHNQTLNNRPQDIIDTAHGVSSIAYRVRNQPGMPGYSSLYPSYRVLRVSEWKNDDPQVNWDDDTGVYGAALDWAIEQITDQTNGIFHVAVIGYSHGAHIAKSFAEKLTPWLGVFQSIRYTAYIDAIIRKENDDHLPAFALKVKPQINGNWHDNFYNNRPWFPFVNWLKGAHVPGSNRSLPIDTTHTAIDDDYQRVQKPISDKLREVMV